MPILAVGRLASMLVDAHAAALRDLELLLPSPDDVLVLDEMDAELGTPDEDARARAERVLDVLGR
ncbi:hypothetical protein [Nocardioides hwasunensis]|uniref:AAA family ATPase n=1 Tax=Nocardioides hwasunensis TaxID=397258 RepID=A0ABR8MGZ3_9ACTN|nr:hypothetical protein [Nocardioides hwasunensis]MBD3915343.1 hypothetical protein [Nocardioides hwasunensis]